MKFNDLLPDVTSDLALPGFARGDQVGVHQRQRSGPNLPLGGGEVIHGVAAERTDAEIDRLVRAARWAPGYPPLI